MPQIQVVTIFSNRFLLTLIAKTNYSSCVAAASAEIYFSESERVVRKWFQF
jgi:hypothetical protein